MEKPFEQEAWEMVYDKAKLVEKIQELTNLGWEITALAPTAFDMRESTLALARIMLVVRRSRENSLGGW
jgi:AICAR transformylase/IMP cyclohydrolase PurH